MNSDAASVDAYVEGLPEHRRVAVATVRQLILENLPDGYEETMQYGMISYVVPLSRFPTTYNGQPLTYLSLASQKRHLSLYLMGVYGDAESDFAARYAATGKKLTMGKSCLRFTRVENLPLDVIAEEVRRLPVDAFLAQYIDAKSSSKRSPQG